MKLPSFLKFLKRKPKTFAPSFRSYKMIGRFSRKKPIVKKSDKNQALASLAPFAQRMIARKNRSRSWIFRWIKIFAVLTLSAGLSYALFLSSLLEIQKIELEKNSGTAGSAETAPSQEETRLSEYLNPLLGSNLLLFNSRKHEATLLTELPSLSGINFKRRWPHTLLIKAEPHAEVANVQLEKADGTFVQLIINELGYVTALVESPDPDLPLIHITILDTESELTVNSQVISHETLETILKTKESFEGKFKINITEIFYLKAARELHLLTERDFTVWIDLTQSPEEQLNKLKKAMTKLNIYESPLDYIDLRISGQNGEKVIYMLKN